MSFAPRRCRSFLDLAGPVSILCDFTIVDDNARRLIRQIEELSGEDLAVCFLCDRYAVNGSFFPLEHDGDWHLRDEARANSTLRCLPSDRTSGTAATPE